MRWFDQLTESWTRRAAQNTSRRSFLLKLGGAAAVTAASPLLPIDRRAQAAQTADGSNGGATAPHPAHAHGGHAKPLPAVNTADAMHAPDHPSDDPTQCEYWRYCGIDGYLCACCGGGPTTCPPGSYASPTAWVGTCFNPADGITYLIAYNDCCGIGECGRCDCWRSEGQTPVYRPQRNNDIIWCFGAPTMAYHCSVSRVIGRAQ